MNKFLLFALLMLIFTNDILIIRAENMSGEERASPTSDSSRLAGENMTGEKRASSTSDNSGLAGVLPGAPGGFSNIFSQMGSDAAQRATVYMGAFQIMAMPMAGMANLAQQGAGTLMGGLPGAAALAPVAAAANGRRRRRRR